MLSLVTQRQKVLETDAQQLPSVLMQLVLSRFLVQHRLIVGGKLRLKKNISLNLYFYLYVVLSTFNRSCCLPSKSVRCTLKKNTFDGELIPKMKMELTCLDSFLLLISHSSKCASISAALNYATHSAACQSFNTPRGIIIL